MAKTDKNKSVPEKVGDAIKDAGTKIKEKADKVSDLVKEKATTEGTKRTPIRKQ